MLNRWFQLVEINFNFIWLWPFNAVKPRDCRNIFETTAIYAATRTSFNKNSKFHANFWVCAVYLWLFTNSRLLMMRTFNDKRFDMTITSFLSFTCSSKLSLNDQNFRTSNVCGWNTRPGKIFSWKFQKLLLSENCWKLIVVWKLKVLLAKGMREKFLNYLWPKNTQTDFPSLNDTDCERVEVFSENALNWQKAKASGRVLTRFSSQMCVWFIINLIAKTFHKFSEFSHSF